MISKMAREFAPGDEIALDGQVRTIGSAHWVALADGGGWTSFVFVGGGNWSGHDVTRFVGAR